MQYVMIAVIVLLVLPVPWLILALWLASFVMTGKRQTLDEAMKWQSEKYDTSFYNDLEHTDYTVKSYDGYELHARLLRCPDHSGKYVIISHGYTDNRIGSLKYARMYIALGYSCILYDLRGHGLNQTAFTTYGIREGQDVAAMVSNTRERYGDITRLGLHDESLGAASTVTSLQYRPQVDFVVADCGFSDIDNVLRGGYRHAGAPVFLVDVADFGARLRYHYSLQKMRPIDSLADNGIPILFFHGADDTFIPPKNSEDMAKRTKGYSELHLIEGAGHAESVLVQPDEYRRFLSAFLAKTENKKRKAEKKQPVRFTMIS